MTEMSLQPIEMLTTSNPGADRQRNALAASKTSTTDDDGRRLASEAGSWPDIAKARTLCAAPRVRVRHRDRDNQSILPGRVIDPVRSGASPASCRSRQQSHVVIIRSHTPHRRSPA